MYKIIKNKLNRKIEILSKEDPSGKGLKSLRSLYLMILLPNKNGEVEIECG